MLKTNFNKALFLKIQENKPTNIQIKTVIVTYLFLLFKKVES